MAVAAAAGNDEEGGERQGRSYVQPGPPLPNSRGYRHWVEQDPNQWRNKKQKFELEADFEIRSEGSEA